jgi:putative membrane protein
MERYEFMQYWFGFIPAPLGMLITIFVLIFAFIVLLRMMPGGKNHRNNRRALEVLEERFARGEIDRAEFEERRKILSGK